MVPLVMASVVMLSAPALNGCCKMRSKLSAAPIQMMWIRRWRRCTHHNKMCVSVCNINETRQQQQRRQWHWCFSNRDDSDVNYARNACSAARCDIVNEEAAPHFIRRRCKQEEEAKKNFSFAGYKIPTNMSKEQAAFYPTLYVA